MSVWKRVTTDLQHVKTLANPETITRLIGDVGIGPSLDTEEHIKLIQQQQQRNQRYLDRQHQQTAHTATTTNPLHATVSAKQQPSQRPSVAYPIAHTLSATATNNMPSEWDPKHKHDGGPDNATVAEIVNAHDPTTRSKPLRHGSKFENPWLTWKATSLRLVMTWQSERRHKQLPKPPAPYTAAPLPCDIDYDPQRPNPALPMVEPHRQKIAEASKPSFEGIQYTFIGHATMLVQMNGVTILTDPVFTSRVGPVSFVGPERFRPAAMTVEELPPLDIIVISHNHFDHLSYPSIRKLEHFAAKQKQETGRTVQWVVPLGIDKWMHRWTSVPKDTIVALDWWGKHASQTSQSVGYTVTATPAQHWSQRALFDKCKTLWCGFVVEVKGKKFYYSGDTGYCPAFREIGDEFGSIGLAMLPIGAYDPRWFMGPQHVDPEHAFEIAKDVNAKCAVACHFASFMLADEPAEEPGALTVEATKHNNRDGFKFNVPALGHTQRL